MENERVRVNWQNAQQQREQEWGRTRVRCSIDEMFWSRWGEWGEGAGKGIRDALSSNVPPNKKRKGKNKKEKKEREKRIGRHRWARAGGWGWAGC